MSERTVRAASRTVAAHHLREALLLALDSIRQHKFRSVLTLLGIILGVATVIGMVAAIEGLNHSVSSVIEELNPNIFIVSRFSPSDMGLSDIKDTLARRPALKLDDSKTIRESAPSVKHVSPFHTVDFIEGSGATVTFRGEDAFSPLVRGVDPFYMEATGLFVVRGRFITGADDFHASPVCVLGADIADGLFDQIEPVGKQLRIDNQPYTVIGVLERRETLFEGPSENQLVLIPFGTYLRFYRGQNLEFLQFICSVREPGDLEKAIDEVKGLLRSKRRLPRDAPDNFSLFTPEQFFEIWKKVTGGIFLLMIIIASIGLLIGGIGVMNIMLISVTERYQEIGVRKAMGARKRDILWQFLLEAILLTTIGGVGGLVLGILVSLAMPLVFPSLRAHIPFWSVAAGLIVSTAVGLFFGIWPATRASRLAPIQALRYER
ncbi:MAG: ABC transporter permease [Acidobacteriota bacterium]